MNVSIIGTAGRDKDRTYDINLWCAMWDDVLDRFDTTKKYTLVSGGAAWADHLAVSLFLARPKWFKLKLFLPSMFAEHTQRFVGPERSAASTISYYHELFTKATGIDGRREIAEAISQGCEYECEPSAAGLGGFFARNRKVALASDACLAYTWGSGREPSSNGTRNTWDQVTGRKVHVSLQKLISKEKV